jgi:hypothetical protein
VPEGPRPGGRDAGPGDDAVDRRPVQRTGWGAHGEEDFPGPRQTFQGSRELCVELPGGLDSGNVAATLGALHPGQVTASALMILGEAGTQQAAWRAELIRVLGLVQPLISS